MHLGSCVPAYGRDYASGIEVYKDWMADKDFIIGGPYINKADAIRQCPKGGSVNVRFKRFTQIAVISWDDKGKVKLNGKTPTQAQLDKVAAKASPVTKTSDERIRLALRERIFNPSDEY